MENIEQALQLQFFSGLPKSLVENAIKGSKVLRFVGGQSVFTAGDQATFFGFVLSGKLKLKQGGACGSETIFHFCSRGEIIGVMSTLAEPKLFPFTCESIGESWIMTIPKNTFVEIWSKSPELLVRYHEELQARLFRAYEERRQLKLDFPQRVAHLLIYLSNFKSEDKGAIDVQLTRRDIACFVNATVESVIRLLSQWKSEGIVDTVDRIIRIYEPQRLVEIANKSFIPDAPTEIVARHLQHVAKTNLFDPLWVNSAVSLQVNAEKSANEQGSESL